MAVELTKQAIATRLLRSAVRAYLRADDPLSTFLLGATSARLLRDLAEARGLDWLEQLLGRSIYYMALDLNDGHYGGPEELRPVVEQVAELVSSGSIASSDDVSVEKLDSAERRSALKLLNRQYNFIKHADRDPLASISDEQIDAELSVASACVLFPELFPQVDLDEITLFRYILQRQVGRGYSQDVKPYACRMDEISDEKLNDALLSFLAFIDREGPD